MHRHIIVGNSEANKIDGGADTMEGGGGAYIHQHRQLTIAKRTILFARIPCSRHQHR
jgi:hypothetical protein